MNSTRPYILALFILFLCLSCRKDKIQNNEPGNVPVVPDKKLYVPGKTQKELVYLGRVLFYDKQLSQNNSIACASCHQQLHAFCDNQNLSAGLNGLKGKRNTPGIFAKKSRVFWDGRAKSLAELALMPVSDHLEMGISNFDYLANKLDRLGYYRELFTQAYGYPLIDSAHIGQALNEFLNTFMFVNNKFRRSLAGGETLSASEQLGRELFFGKARCASCHNIEKFDSGNSGGYGTAADNFIGFNIGLDEVYSDIGIATVTGKSSDRGSFMIPLLLNAEYTWPYMHDGRFNTLEEVVEHYNSGIKNHPNLAFELRDLGAFPGMNPNQVIMALDADKNGKLEGDELKDLPPVRLNLNASEKNQLVTFLKTLSDPGIKTNADYSNPFNKK